MNPTCTRLGGLPLGRHQPQGRLGIHRQRLFTQCRLPVLDAGHHLLLVREAGRRDQDGVDVRISNECQRILEGLASRESRLQRGHAGSVRVRHRHELRAGDPPDEAEPVNLVGSCSELDY